MKRIIKNTMYIALAFMLMFGNVCYADIIAPGAPVSTEGKGDITKMIIVGAIVLVIVIVSIIILAKNEEKKEKDEEK